MDIDSFRNFCLGLPHTTEDVKWENDLTFLIGGKMFAVAALEPSSVVVSFKCTPEDFARLTEKEGVVPAPYLARYDWVALEDFEAIEDPELETLIKRSYELIFDKLPAPVRKELS